MSPTDFPTFGTRHMVYISFCLAIWFALPFIGKNYLSSSQRIGVALFLAYFWGLVGALQGILTPDPARWPYGDISIFWNFLSHGIVILNVVWLILVGFSLIGLIYLPMWISVNGQEKGRFIPFKTA
ncbi:YwaF family protein [Candidatus Marinimicrobia bacterium]|nr:YwaF family protein [Candidatus Neomarinimicrobiota bacterium]